LLLHPEKYPAGKRAVSRNNAIGKNRISFWTSWGRTHDNLPETGQISREPDDLK
jgi:hypothetical protein